MLLFQSNMVLDAIELQIGPESAPNPWDPESYAFA